MDPFDVFVTVGRVWRGGRDSHGTKVGLIRWEVTATANAEGEQASTMLGQDPELRGNVDAEKNKLSGWLAKPDRIEMYDWAESHECIHSGCHLVDRSLHGAHLLLYPLHFRAEGGVHEPDFLRRHRTN